MLVTGVVVVMMMVVVVASPTRARSRQQKSRPFGAANFGRASRELERDKYRVDFAPSRALFPVINNILRFRVRAAALGVATDTVAGPVGPELSGGHRMHASSRLSRGGAREPSRRSAS
jgi:hypothetical protein